MTSPLSSPRSAQLAVVDPGARRAGDLAVSAVVRAGADVRAAAERAVSLQAAAQAIVDVLDGSATRFYLGTRFHAGKTAQSTVDDGAVLGGLLADPPPEGLTVARDRMCAGLVGPGLYAFGGELTAGERFAVIVEVGQCVVDIGANGLLAVAAAARAGLLRHAVGAGADEQLAAVRDALTLLERVVSDGASALERMVARQHADGRLIDTLRDVGQRLTAQLDLDKLVQDATDAATTATGAQFGAFFYNVVNEYGESYMLYTLSGAPRSAFARFPMPRNTALFAPTFTGEGTVRSGDITADPRYGRNGPHRGMPAGHLPVVSYLAVPVVSPTSHEVLGAFFFGHPGRDRFTDGHARLAEGIAGYAAIGLDNARLYARERTLATELQRSMLPTIAQVPGYTVVGRYLPAATGSEIGGDWLDVIELPGGRTAFVIGDVMGRGLPAASTMGQVRTAVRAYAMLDLSPRDVLRHASSLAMAMPGQQFVTCVYAVHDPVEAVVTYANAGHPAPAVISPDGTVTFHHERLGMPLRVGESFEERVVAFPAGSALLLYTDGLLERKGRPLPEGIEQLDAALRSLLVPADDASTACDRLIQDMTLGDYHDDVALLYARDIGSQRQIAVLPLDAEPVAASRARRFVAETLVRWGLLDTSDLAAMVVTELVSNAVRHSKAPIALRLHHTSGRLILEVLDSDDRLPRPIQPAIHDENHRGLFIVESLAQRWGSRASPHGKIVWAELNTAGQS